MRIMKNKHVNEFPVRPTAFPSFILIFFFFFFKCGEPIAPVHNRKPNN